MASRKVIVLGDPEVGKTSLVRRLVHGRFEKDYLKTLGVDISTYIVAIPAELRSRNDGASELRLMIWDTDGDLGMRIFRESFFKGSSAALIVADLTRSETQASMQSLAQGFDDACPGRPSTLVLNKLDLVSDQTIVTQSRSALEGHRVVATSALNGENVRRAFEDTARLLLTRGL
jgi:small GTP-binding protein